MRTIWTKDFKRVYAMAYRQEYYPANKEKINKYSKAYRKKFPLKHKKAFKRYYNTNHLAMLMYFQLIYLSKK